MFSVQTAGYDNAVIPEYGYRTNLLYGWTGKELSFADTMIKFWDEKDNREKGGALWIVGGHEFDEVIEACEDLGFHFIFTEKGGRVTKGLPGWYLRN